MKKELWNDVEIVMDPNHAIRELKFLTAQTSVVKSCHLEPNSTPIRTSCLSEVLEKDLESKLKVIRPKVVKLVSVKRGSERIWEHAFRRHIFDSGVVIIELSSNLHIVIVFPSLRSLV